MHKMTEISPQEFDFLRDSHCLNCKNGTPKDQGTFCTERNELMREPQHCSMFDKKEIINLEETKKTPLPRLTIDVLQCLADKPPRRDEASEIVTREFLTRNHIYAIRDDKSDELWMYHKGIYIPEGKSYIEEFCRKILGRKYTTSFSNQVIAKIMADSQINKEDFFDIKNKYEIAVQNGILNIKKRTLTDFTPKRIFFNKLGIDYIPGIKIDKMKEFFQEILSKDDVEVIQELFGYLLLKDYPVQKAFMFLGSGSNGKSALLTLIKEFIGDDNCSNVTLDDLQQNDFAASELFQKHVNIAGDLSNKTLTDTSKFKQITGGDRIAANRKFMTPIYFTNFAKMINACNELPQTRDLSEGFWRRWVLINFKQKFAPIKDFEKLSVDERKKVKLADPAIIQTIMSETEMSGLLNWALNGFERITANQGFSYSKTGNEVQSEWIRKSNSFAAFCMDCLKEDYEGFVPKELLMEEYSKYCKNHRVKVESSKVIRIFITENMGCWTEQPTIKDSFERPRIWKGCKFSGNIVCSLKYNDEKGYHYE